LKYVQDGNPERSQFRGGLSLELGMCKFMINFASSRLQALKQTSLWTICFEEYFIGGRFCLR